MEKTIKNLTKAFIGESIARNRYTLFAKQATKEGLHQIAEIFTLTAEQEQQHATWLYRMITELKGDSIRYEEVMVETGLGTKIGDTITNLNQAIGGEHHETVSMYPDFAKIAKEEGLEHIAARLIAIANAEKHHEQRYIKLLIELENGTLWKKHDNVIWTCRKCGYMAGGKTPPEKCPSCDHETNHFQILCENY